MTRVYLFSQRALCSQPRFGAPHALVQVNLWFPAQQTMRLRVRHGRLFGEHFDGAAPEFGRLAEQSENRASGLGNRDGNGCTECAWMVAFAQHSVIMAKELVACYRGLAADDKDLSDGLIFFRGQDDTIHQIV